MKIEAKDIVALVGLCGSFVLLGLGINTLVAYVVIAIIAYYFGSCKVASVLEAKKLKTGGKKYVEEGKEINRSYKSD